MLRNIIFTGILCFGFALLFMHSESFPAQACANDDETADQPEYMKDIRILNKDKNKQYFFLGPKEGVKRPKKGWGLVIIMPGGPGTAAFHPWIKSMYQQAIPDNYIAVQPVAKHWEDPVHTVWPTKYFKAEGMKFNTEEFVEELIQEVKKKYPLNMRTIFTLTWSSSGPTAYVISLDKESSVTGSFLAMSVFRREWMPNSLAAAKQHAYYIYHSPQDNVCPWSHAEDAVQELKKQGAKVELKSYKGGHGWPPPMSMQFENIKNGMLWLEQNAKVTKKK